MARRFFMLALCIIPTLALGPETQQLASLQAKLASHYAKLLATAKAEDEDARNNNLPAKYATQEEILKTNEAAFEEYMRQECVDQKTETSCQIKLISSRLAILDYDPKD